jgi:glycerophosphoryl diester phosphodiesterase
MSATVLVCHRGASMLAPENSLEAFRVAMSYGVDFSELDVHVGQDGELVVTHDEVLDPVLEASLPRLREVFELVKGTMGIYVELKGAGTGAALGKLVRELGPSRLPELIVGSFVLDLVAQVRAAAPELPRSILFGTDWCDQTERMIEACREYDCLYAHPCFRPIEPALIEAFHAADLRVMTPHTNDAAEARRFATIGVDVVASDDPRILLPLRSLTRA